MTGGIVVNVPSISSDLKNHYHFNNIIFNIILILWAIIMHYNSDIFFPFLLQQIGVNDNEQNCTWVLSNFNSFLINTLAIYKWSATKMIVQLLIILYAKVSNPWQKLIQWWTSSTVWAVAASGGYELQYFLRSLMDHYEFW